MKDELKRYLGPRFADEQDDDDDPKPAEKDPKAGRTGDLELEDEAEEESPK